MAGPILGSPDMLMGLQKFEKLPYPGIEILTLGGGDGGDGVPLIQIGTPLTRLNYFDGKFLRASDLQGEQTYFRELIALSNQAVGAGVVYGFDVTLAGGDQLHLSAGLGIGPGGRVLYLPNDATISISKLIDATSKVSSAAVPIAGGGADFADCIADVVTQPTDPVVRDADLYLITVCHAEGLCGEEDVFGKLCEEACVTSTGRPFRVEGVVVRATPLVITAKLATSKVIALNAIHQRSIVASAYFETERTSLAHQSLISGDGLRSGAWCLGAKHEGGCGVPVGVIARAGRVTLFLDAWTGRRERIDPPPRSYWAWKMMMRPWNVFLAQILQFQCQLHEVLGRAPDPAGGNDECSDQEEVLTRVNKYLGDIRARLESDPAADNRSLALFRGGMTGLAEITSSVSKALVKVAKGVTDRVLINGGIVELPPAGYLPVVAGSSVSVNEQVRALVGEGLDLRFCIVRPDYVAHALETAQHMERISLLSGIDDPTHKPEVDILVPDGAVDTAKASTDRIFAASLFLGTDKSGALKFLGAARSQRLAGDGRAFHLAAIGQADSAFTKLVSALTDLKPGSTPVGGLTERVVATPIDFSNRFVEGTANVTDGLRRMRFDRVNAAAFSTAPAAGPAPVQPALSDYVGRTGSNVDGAWLSMRTDRPLSSVSPTSPTAQFTGRMIIGNVKGDNVTGLELSATGSASFVQERPDVGAGRRVDAMLSLTLTATTIKETSSTELEVIMARRMTQPITMTITGDDAQGEIITQLNNVLGGGLRIRTIWGTPTGALQSEIFTVDNSTTPPTENRLVNVALEEDVSIMDETNARHRYATMAIGIVQAVLFTEDSFEQDALKALFAPLTGDDDFAIRAVNDWVMFHRRRSRQCEAPPPVKRVEPPRRYRVFEITARDANEAKAWNDAAMSTAAADQQRVAARLNPTGMLLARVVRAEPDLIVEFEGGLSTLRSDPAAIAADWPGFTPGALLAYALVARPNADRTLELSRLGTVEGVLPDTDTRTVTSTYLTTVPNGWSDPTTDGSMLFITIGLVLDCQRAFAVADLEQWRALQNQLARTGSAAAAAAFLNGQLGETLVDLGTPLFKEGTDAPGDANQLPPLKTAFAQRFPNAQAAAVFVWIPANDAAQAAHVAQGAAIGQAVVGTAQVHGPFGVPQVDPGMVAVADRICPAMTFVVVLQ
jgi:hypothetical protein